MRYWMIAVVWVAAVAVGACSDDKKSKADAGPGEGDTDEGFQCYAVEPGAVSTLVDGTFSLIGLGFEDGMTVTAFDEGEDEHDLGAADVASETGATVSTAAGELPSGSYHLRLHNPTGIIADCPDDLGWLDEQPPTVTDVAPPTAWAGLGTDTVISDQDVIVSGTDFEETPMVTWIAADDPGQRFPAALVLFGNAEQLDAICASETLDMPEGDYYVEATNPSGLGAFWQDGDELGIFQVTGTPPPLIEEVDPFRSPAADDVTFTVTGDYFQDGAVVQMVLPGDELLDIPTTFEGETLLTAELASNTVGQGVYPMRVMNPDSQYDMFYSYQATPSSAGHLDSFLLTDEELVRPRWRHGACAGFDDFGGSYIFNAGGMDADGDVLANVEVIPLSGSGEPGSPFLSRQWIDEDSPRAANAMTTPRQGLTLVRAGMWLYAIGGVDVNTALAADPLVEAFDTVERARILGTNWQPDIESTTVVDNGDLETGTWYYRVTAVGPWGESLASWPSINYGAGGTIGISWNGVAGATSYNVYRNADASGNAGDVRLLAAGVSGTSYLDSGEATPDPDGVTPLPFGSLGRWELLDETMTVGREGPEAVVALVPSGEEDVDDSTYLFVVGGRPDASGTGYHVSGERAEVLYDGTLGPFVQLSNDLNTPRAFYVLLTNQGQEDPGFGTDPEVPIDKSTGDGPLYLMAIQGDDEHSGTANNGLNDFEVTEIITADGDNGPWTTQTDTLPGGRATHGLGALLYFDYMFAFGGVDTEDIGEDPDPIGASTSRLEYHEDADLPEEILQSYQSTSASLNVPRAYYRMVRRNGYLWVTGGNDGTGPVGVIERTLQ